MKGTRGWCVPCVPSRSLSLAHGSSTRPDIPPSDSFASTIPGLHSHALIRRITLLALLFAVELLVISIWLDDASLSRSAGLVWMIGRWGAWILKFIVLFAVLFVIFGCHQAGNSLLRISARLSGTSIARDYLAGHLFAMATFGLLSVSLYGGSLSGFTADLIAGAWLAAGVVALALAASAFVPPGLWLEAARATGHAWIYASTAGAAACLLGSASRILWRPAARVTFLMVKTILRAFASGVIADPTTDTIGISSFQVQIAASCSGLEGIGLVLVFGSAWLWLFRREFRFPRALLLIPAGVVAIFLANSLRISALILIGAAGAPGVATGGFHSQAGWIVFIAVAVGFGLTAQRLPWVTVPGGGAVAPDRSAENPTAPYLVPLLAILAAAMISRASSAGFEWLYPLRFFAAAVVLWSYRRRYAALDWKFGWIAPAIGTLVFAMWIGLDWIRHQLMEDGIAIGLTAYSAPVRIAWLGFRVLAAVVTVPIAEELAFRGFLIRRLVAADFEAVDPRKFAWFPVFISSAAFGALHGDRWLAGTAAGVLYAATLRWRGRIGDAVVAHAATNVLLASWVLISGNWSLW
jgi:exosortase E/protease (VPEID-CTERM system)